MIKSWIIRGVPLTIHTTNFVRYFNGSNLDIEPKAMISPKGNAPIRVTKNNFNVCIKPTFNAPTTIGSCSINKSISVFSLCNPFCLIAHKVQPELCIFLHIFAYFRLCSCPQRTYLTQPQGQILF